MVGGKGGDACGGEDSDRGEGTDAELHHERYDREKMRGEGGAVITERVGRVAVGLVTCHGRARLDSHVSLTDCVTLRVVVSWDR